MDFKDLISSEKQEIASTTEEARFSFIKGVYVEDNFRQGMAYALLSIHVSLCEQVLYFYSTLLWLTYFLLFCLIRFYRVTIVFLDCLAPTENEEQSETSLALAEVAERALNIKTQHNDTILYQGGAISSIDYLKARSYRGLTGEYEDPAPDSILVGRTGRAAGYSDERTQA